MRACDAIRCEHLDELVIADRGHEGSNCHKGARCPYGPRRGSGAALPQFPPRRARQKEDEANGSFFVFSRKKRRCPFVGAILSVFEDLRPL